MRESVTERKGTQRAAARGWLEFKIERANRRGYPDRLYLRAGRLVFIEWKRRGRQPSRQQLRRLLEAAIPRSLTSVAELLVRAEAAPRADVAGVLPGPLAPRLVAVLARSGDDVKGPEQASGPDVVADDVLGLAFLDHGAIAGASAQTGDQLADRGLRDVTALKFTEPGFLPNDSVGFTQNGNLRVVSFDARSRRVTGAARPGQDGIAAGNWAGMEVASFDLSPHGDLVFVPGRLNFETRLVWVDRSGKETAIATDPVRIDARSPRTCRWTVG